MQLKTQIKKKYDSDFHHCHAISVTYNITSLYIARVFRHLGSQASLKEVDRNAPQTKNFKNCPK